MILYLILVFLVGSAVGSFLNVVIDRVVRGESILGRSYCDHCKSPLSPFDLVPIVSFIGLGARCRYCKKRISWQYPIVEASCAVLFTLAVYMLTLNGLLSFGYLIFWFFLIAILVIVAVIDFRFSLIPTTFVFFASLVSLFFSYFFNSSQVFVENVLAAFSAAMFFLLIVVLTRGRGMGEGDIVLGFLMGMVLGFAGTIVALFLAFMSGAMVAILLLAIGRKKLGQTVPFAPFLVLGFLTSLFWGGQLVDLYFGMLY